MDPNPATKNVESHAKFSLGPVVEISLDVEMWIDAPDKQATEGRRDAIYAMEWAIELFAAELNHAFAETGIGHSLGCQAGPLPAQAGEVLYHFLEFMT